MARLLLVSPAADSPTVASTASRTIPALSLLSHEVRPVAPDTDVLGEASRVDAVIVDATDDLATARQMCRLLSAAGSPAPVLLVLTEGGFAAVTTEWSVNDIVLATAGPAEFEARIRMLVAPRASEAVVTSGGITIDESAYHATLNGQPLDLTYTEFELLKYLVQHPGRVFTRETLLSDVWGYDYYGGTRTVDVHVRRLRAKLGVEHEGLIGTVRNVGYRFSPEMTRSQRAS